MKLRARLAVATILVMVPMTFALFWYDGAARHRAAEQNLTEFVFGQMPTSREACEAAPSSFGGELRPSRPPGPPRGNHPPPGDPPPPPPPGRPGPPRPRGARPAVVHAYDESLHSANPDAPVIPEALARAIREQDVAIASYVLPTSSVEILARMPWGTGPCAYVLARGTTDPTWGAVLPESNIWLLPTVAVFAAMLLALGPVVRRIRKLTEAVERSASATYADAVLMEGDDEIGVLARAFNAAGREIRSQLEEKDRREQALRHFLANTTHDVMIPLTVLQGHLATLREDAAAGKPVDVGALVSAMDEAHYMASLVHNLAATARLEAADVKLQRCEVDLEALVKRVVGRHKPIAKQLGVSIETAVPGEPVTVSADVTLLEQAISNVTYNAVRYNRPGGHVAVILERVTKESFRLRVVDDGPGIPEAELSRLAERGFRGNEARSRAPDGQGLGLHITLRAAELHGFRLTLRPSEYGGLEVELEGKLDAPIG
ncbi:HAMP domain-containing sensor histidine kinase [Polyangium sp. y55x31]|uniref:sensor histidine kinase n=1 Tax=Polyangium sp. y55x31 TaxID=3042688 RepID=UPI002482DC51|nr:HAMP domain-containing sensor histidine kinase [Polyangium sp. y55x31]MDI1478181.1 HAMP domain-containing sensor histidine kinase [Polyangium sp. y55x31]